MTQNLKIQELELKLKDKDSQISHLQQSLKIFMEKNERLAQTVSKNLEQIWLTET